MFESWMEDADCATTDPDAFFPEQYDSALAAKKICQGCPVAAQCLEYALEHGIEYGIWGGVSAGQRKSLLRKRRLSGGHVRDAWSA